MARFVPNPDFGRDDIAKAIKGNIACPQCGKEIKISGLSLKDGTGRVICPSCGIECKIKGIPDKLF